MKITLKWMKEHACQEAVEEYQKQSETDGLKLIKKCIKGNKLDWANWLITKIMNRKQYLAYAIFAAEQVINVFEIQYPANTRLREAIEAAKKVLKYDTKKNRVKAACAADAVYAAADAYTTVAVAVDTAPEYIQKGRLLKLLNYGISLSEDKI